ncbi:hypothetical protein ACFL1H_06330 [Nanoarchaeota archaeon]
MKYKELVEIYQQLEKTSKRLEKTFILASFLKHHKGHEQMQEIILLIQGRIFPFHDETKIGVSSQYIIKAIATATGSSPAEIENQWTKTGDLGLVSEKLVEKKKQATLFSQSLTVKKVFQNLQKLPTLTGSGSVDQKVGLIAELLTSAKPEEAKYIVRTVLEEMRVGVASGTLRDSIVWSEWDYIKNYKKESDKKKEKDIKQEEDKKIR